MLIEKNLGLVHSVVKRFLGRGQEAEDLFQVGCIGLTKAVQKFDNRFGVRFSTYAVPMILGEIKRFLRDDGMIKVSRAVKETAARALALRAELTGKTGAEPTVGELAETLGISTEELSAALESALPTESIYATVDDGTREQASLLDRLESDETPEEDVVNKVTMETLFCDLEGRDKTIIYLRYYQQKTQTEIARRLGISQVQVSRIEKRILTRMREKLQDVR